MPNDPQESKPDALHEPKPSALSRRQFLDVLSKSAVATAAFSLLAMTDGAADAATRRSHIVHRHNATTSPYHPYGPPPPYHPYGPPPPYGPYKPYCGPHPYGPPPPYKPYCGPPSPYHPYGPPPPYHPYKPYSAPPPPRNPYKVY